MGNDALYVEWLQVCIYQPEDELAPWTMGCLASIACPSSVRSWGPRTRNRRRMSAHGSILRIHLPSDAGSQGALLEVT